MFGPPIYSPLPFWASGFCSQAVFIVLLLTYSIVILQKVVNIAVAVAVTMVNVSSELGMYSVSFESDLPTFQNFDFTS